MEAMTHQQAGAFGPARDCWLAVLDQQPGNAAARGQLGVAEFWLGQREGGLKQLRQAIRSAPQDAALPYLMAGLQMELGRSRQALGLLNKSARLATHNPVLQGLVVDDLIRMGRPDQALKAVAAVEEGRAEPAALSALAKAHLAAGNFDRGYAYAAKAHALDPHNPFAMEAYGAALLLLEREDAFSTLLQSVEQMPPELCERLLLIWARLLEINTRPERAWDFLTALANAGTETISVLIDHARLALALDRNEAAQRSLSRLTALKADFPTLHLLWGQYYTHQKDWPRAVPALRRALEGSPTALDAYELLRRCGALNDRDCQALATFVEDKALARDQRAQASKILVQWKQAEELRENAS